MHKNELIRAISTKTGIQFSTVETVMNAFTDITANEMAMGESVVITGFGLFEPKSRSPRVGRNPHTGDFIDIPARIMPTFRPSKSLRDLVSGLVPNAASNIEGATNGQ